MVRVYNWVDYIDETVLGDFTRESGIKVVYETFDTNDDLESKLLAGGTGYDLVVPGDAFLSRQIQAGIFAKLDKSRIPNWKNLDPEMMRRAARFDQTNAYAAIYLWGTTGIAYNEQAIKQRMPDAPVNSWRLVFDPGGGQAVRRLWHLHAGCGGRDGAGGAELHRRGAGLQGPGRHRQSRAGPGGGAALHPRVPHLGSNHRRLGQRRHLSGGNLVGRCRHGRRPHRGGGQAV